MEAHELSAKERMPAVIAQKRRVSGMTNLFVEGINLVAEANNCSLKEAAGLIAKSIHKRYLEVMEEERIKEQFGPMPDAYDPKNDPDIVR
jgi:hypothetical protein